MKPPRIAPQTAWGQRSQMADRESSISNIIPIWFPKHIKLGPVVAIPVSAVIFLCPQFCERQALLFYLESEPQKTSPVPNVESLGAVALTVGRSHVGSSQNYVIFIGCWKWTINQIDVIQHRSYVGLILLLVQRPPGFYTMRIFNLSRPGFEPQTFGLAYLRANQ